MQVAKNCQFLHIPYSSMVEQPEALQLNEMTNSEIKYALNFKSNSKLFPPKM